MESATEGARHRKARGAFFTPAPLCRHIAAWAIRHPTDRVLERSCGEAAFLLAAAAPLRDRSPDLRQASSSRDF